MFVKWDVKWWPMSRKTTPFGTPKIVSLVFEEEYVQEGCKGLNLNKRPTGLNSHLSIRNSTLLVRRYHIWISTGPT